MFNIVFKLHIHGCFATMSSLDVHMSHDVAMPFIPPVGMEVIDGEWSAVVESLVYCNGVVLAFVPEDKELYDAGLKNERPQRTIDEIVAEYEQQGWVRSKGVLSV